MLNRRDKERYLTDIKNRDAGGIASFRGIDLSGMRIKELELTNIDFSGGCFKRTQFIKCVIKNSYFRAVDFRGALFEGCIIMGVNMEFANLNNAVILRSSVSGADMRNLRAEKIKISFSEMISVHIDGSNFRCSTIEDNKLEKASARGCSFRDALISNNLFSHTDLSASDFTSGVWRKNRFIKASLDAISAVGLDIRGINFESGTLFKADFVYTNGIDNDFRKLIIAQQGLDGKRYSRVDNIVMTGIVLFLAGGLYLNHHFSLDAILTRVRKLESKRQFGVAENIVRRKLSQRHNLSSDAVIRLTLSLARIYHHSGRPDEARKLYEEASAMSNEWYSLDAYNGLAMIRREKGEHLEAINIYNKLLSVIPAGEGWRRHHVRLYMADAYSDMGNTDEALKICQKELESTTDVKSVVETKSRMFSLLERLNKGAEALKLCDELLSIPGLGRQQRGELLLKKANMLRGSGRPDEARKLYEEAGRYNKN